MKIAFAFLAFCAVASASVPATPSRATNSSLTMNTVNLDNVYVSGAFLEVLKMQAGFFLLEVGCVTKASTTEIMTKVTLSGRLAATCAAHFRVTA